MARTREETLREITHTYLSQIDLNNIPSPADIEADILDKTAQTFKTVNATRDKTDTKWKIPDKLVAAQIADILLTIYPIVNLACAGINADREYDLLAIYQTQGENKGIYVTSEHILHQLARQYCYTLSSRELTDVMNILKDRAKRVNRCDDKNLIAVNNGIFDYDTKELLPFSPDKVFITKSKVNYNTKAKNIVIHNSTDNTDWDIENWMKELFEDDETRETIWQILGAIIRPNVRWNKSAWFYSNTGNNGKGTLCELMRQLSGDGSYASIPLSDFSKEFMLEPLTRASAIIVDENDVGSYIDKAANLKAIITNDVIQMNRKFKSPIAFQFKGFMVQCLNEMPKIKDKSDSFYRRQLFIPFTKCFTGAERKYIKNDYLHRSEVLEYVLYKVLHMNYYELNEPKICQEALNQYKEFNDPIRAFLNEILPQCQWDLLPYAFLYDLYKAWYQENNASNTGLQGKNTFINDVINIIPNYPEWIAIKSNERPQKPNGKMDKPEPLIREYTLKTWCNPMYTTRNDDRYCRPTILKSSYRGLERTSSITNP